MSIPKLIVLAVVGIVAISGAPLEPEPIAILRQSLDGPNPDGSYSWSYETANGIKAKEQGGLVASKLSDEPAIAVQGSYSYTADDGTLIETSYVADENGFQPRGSHLPTPPPIPPAILRGLEWIVAHPEEDNV